MIMTDPYKPYRIKISNESFQGDPEVKMRKNCIMLLKNWLDYRKEYPIVGSILTFEIVEEEKNVK